MRLAQIDGDETVVRKYLWRYTAYIFLVAGVIAAGTLLCIFTMAGD
jgi:hypothetical protein